jgi:hypothetical protein
MVLILTRKNIYGLTLVRGLPIMREQSVRGPHTTEEQVIVWFAFGHTLSMKHIDFLAVYVLIAITYNSICSLLTFVQ